MPTEGTEAEAGVHQDLLGLAKEDKGATRTTLARRMNLAREIFGRLEVPVPEDVEVRGLLLIEVLSRVASSVQAAALSQKGRTINWHLDLTFQAAAAAELLELTDRAAFELILDEYVKNKEIEVSAQRHRRTQILTNVYKSGVQDSRGQRRKAQERAAVWIGQTRSGVRDKEAQLLQAFESEMVAYVVSHREELVEVVAGEANPVSQDLPEPTGIAPPVGEIAWPLVTEAETRAAARQVILEPKHRGEISSLANLMASRLRSEQLWHHDNDPLLLPIRFENAGQDLIDHWTKIRGTRNNEPIILDGTLDNIDEIYGRVPSGRLVIFGKGGAGKTTLARELALRLLQRRSSEEEPVPVIFRLSSWRSDESVESWMAGELTTRFNYRKRSLRKLIEELLANNLLLPILDGFDEITSLHRSQVIDKINSFALGCGLGYVVTSRVDEFAEAIGSGRYLDGAAGVAIRDLALDDLRHYLPYMRQKGVAPDSGWEPILERLGSKDDVQAAMLLEVLSTPLMTSIAAAVYRDPVTHPRELLAEFKNVDALRDSLIDQYVQVVYKRPLPGKLERRSRQYNPERAGRWLYYLAARTTSYRNDRIQWWRYPAHEFSAWLSAGAVLIVGLPVMLAISLTVDDVGNNLVALSIAWTVASWCLAVVLSPGSDPRKLTLRAFTGTRLLSARQWARDGSIFAILMVGAWLTLTNTSPIIANLDSLPFPWVPDIAGFAQLLTLPVLILAMLSNGRAEVDGAISPSSTLKNDRVAALVRGMMLGTLIVAFIVICWHFDKDAETPRWIVVCWFFVAVVTTFLASASGRWFLWALYTLLTRNSPLCVMKFWRDAHYRSILRQEGGAYLFRHRFLQARLAETYLQSRESPKISLTLLNMEVGLLFMRRMELGLDDFAGELRRIRDTPKDNFIGHANDFRLETWRLLVNVLWDGGDLDGAVKECRLMRSSRLYRSFGTNVRRRRVLDFQYIDVLMERGDCDEAEIECSKLLKKLKRSPSGTAAERRQCEEILYRIREVKDTLPEILADGD